MTWGGIKRGDSVIVAYDLGGRQERLYNAVVVSVGRSWITIGERGGQKSKFDIETGHGEYGYRLHTKTTLAEERRRVAALHTIHGFHRWNSLPVGALEQIAALLTTPETTL